MILRDLKNNLDAVQSLAPAARTASANGAAVNLQDYGGALAIVSLGLWTDGSFSFKLQESDSEGSGFTDVATADLIGAFTVVDGVDDDNTVQRVGYRGVKQYLRVVETEAGGSPAAGTGLVAGAIIVRGHPKIAPIS